MKTILSIFLLVSFTLTALAQNPEKVKRIDALKAAFITKKLDLKPEEAKTFWPVYNNYQEEITTLVKQKRKNRTENKEKPQEALDNDVEYEAKIVDVKKRYQKEFSKVLPAQKVLDLYNAEREFREELIRELRERHKD